MSPGDEMAAILVALFVLCVFVLYLLWRLWRWGEETIVTALANAKRWQMEEDAKLYRKSEDDD